MDMRGKVLYRLGLEVGSHYDFRRNKACFDRTTKEHVNHLLSLYESLEETGGVISPQTTEHYKACFQKNKKCSAERILEKVKKVIGFEQPEKNLFYLRYQYLDTPHENDGVIEEDMTRELQELMLVLDGTVFDGE